MPTFPDILIPLWILLIPYGIFGAFFLLWSAFNIYHLLRFGVVSMSLSLVMAFYLIGTASLVFFSVSLLLRFDWMISVNLTEFIFSENGSSVLPLL